MKSEEKRVGEREKMERIRKGGRQENSKKGKMETEKKRERLRSVESEKGGDPERLPEKGNVRARPREIGRVNRERNLNGVNGREGGRETGAL